MSRYFFLAAMSFFVFLTGCQTSMLKQFSAIKPGMEKAQVLELMGSPQISQRFHGKDRWTYIFYDSEKRFEKEVQFDGGNAVYVGDIWQPEIEKSAPIQDAKIEEKNKKIDEQLAEDKKQKGKAFEAYEKKVKGTEGVQYLPVFKPIK